jgi:hypothetical protein
MFIFANSMEIESDMCKGHESRCNSVNLRNPNVHFRKVNTKTTFGMIQFEPKSKVSGIFSDYDLYFTVIFSVRDLLFTYVGIWFVYTLQKLEHIC